MADLVDRLRDSLGRETLKGALPRGRPTFLTRTATDYAAQLSRRSSLPNSTRSEPLDTSGGLDQRTESYKPLTNASEAPPHQHEHSKQLLGHFYDGISDGCRVRDVSKSQRRAKGAHDTVVGQSFTAQTSRSKSRGRKYGHPKVGSVPRPIGGSEKLGTFSGVFVPTSLNVLSILMFIRFGLILGQGGVLGMMGMLVAAYMINLVTTMSISAVASNGTVRGGGAYYLISRSLGPEFGGSIGIVFYLGFVFNTGMNAVGLVDCLNQNFGSESGGWSNFLPEGFWWQYLWSTIVLILCTAICLAGSALFARCSNGLLAILLVATFSIPLSALILRPFESIHTGVEFSGIRGKTFRENLMPRFTEHAAGSQLEGKENYQDLFGILFPATGGIFAGASMSGDLKNPSRSIPRGTLYGLALTFVCYMLVIFAMAASITRQSFYNNVNVIQETNISGILVLLGEFATTFFSALMGVIGPAKLLQAIARDSLLPGLSVFGQGTAKSDEPTYAILLTYAVAQVTMLFDINRIASFITMTYLMTFLVTNLACFLLKISSAPNFRPSFHYFNWYTALAGTIVSGASMFFVDGLYATGCVGILIIIFLLIHYTAAPKSWGDVSQSLIYHQVRKYLLRLRQEHVKFWRPQILLFVNDPRRGYKLIQFCNSLKKGALFILGHVIVTTNFGASVPEARRQQAAWTKYIDFSQIKAFVNVAISPSVEWGTRNIVLSAGLGGMRPNIIIMGFYNLQQFRQEQPLVDVPSPPPERKASHFNERTRKKKRKSHVAKQLEGFLPTDSCHVEGRLDVQSYVMVLEDMLLKLQVNLAIATGFQDLELPNPKEGNIKKYIDLWPIQMSAEIASGGGADEHKVLTSNFDTYTMILQLGTILNTVPSWRKSYELRVAVFVEYESDVEEERERVASLLGNLRIEAQVLVFWLALGDVKSYQVIVNGVEEDADAVAQVEKVLEDEEWWRDLQKFRGKIRTGDISAIDELARGEDIPWPTATFQQGRDTSAARFEGLRQLIKGSRRRPSLSKLNRLGVSLGMRTHRLDDDLISRHASILDSSDDLDPESASGSFASDSAVEGSDEAGIEGESTSGNISEDERPQFTYGEDEEPMPPSLVLKKSRHPKKDSDGGGSKKSTSSKKRSLRMVGHSRMSSFIAGNETPGHTLVDVTSPSRSPPAIETGPRGRPGVPEDAPQVDASDSKAKNQALFPSDQRRSSRSRSPGNFTSSPVPIARVASEEGVGPSIMFAEDPRPTRLKTGPEDTPSPHSRSIYRRKALDSESPSAPADGFPSAAAVPLSFNDLPSRAQHLIINDLMTQNSEDTAVIFTTLPAPVEGTYKSETDSLGYVSDLEILCGGLPPTLMVHSNSMTVTMNL